MKFIEAYWFEGLNGLGGNGSHWRQIWEIENKEYIKDRANFGGRGRPSKALPKAGTRICIYDVQPEGAPPRLPTVWPCWSIIKEEE